MSWQTKLTVFIGLIPQISHSITITQNKQIHYTICRFSSSINAEIQARAYLANLRFADSIVDKKSLFET